MTLSCVILVQWRKKSVKSDSAAEAASGEVEKIREEMKQLKDKYEEKRATNELWI